MQTKNSSQQIKYAFFGSSELSVIILEKMKSLGFEPDLVITVPDQPKGRKLTLTAPETKVWADENNIPSLQLKTLRSEESFEQIKKFGDFDIFIVASYGKIIPDNILYYPKYKTLNIHPSLLPKLRGASPIKSAILAENETGTSIIVLDSEMDHGPIIFQEKVSSPEWPPYEEELEKTLAEKSAEAICKILPDWINGEINPVEQDHNKATFCGKVEKKDGEINLSNNPETNLRKIRAFHRWPTAYFFENGKRIIVKKARIENGQLVIERVLPEGKKEMPFEDYNRGKRS